MIKGVITGDIVDSTLIPIECKPTVIEVLDAVIADFSTSVIVNYEMFRGDSFQVVVDNKDYALSVAIAIRAALRANTPEGQEPWDARIAIGLGEVSFQSSSIVTSDGEAFRLSGREFDNLGKRRLSIVTPWEDVNEELKLSTSFADDIISKWTVKQAEVIYARIFTNVTQKELAEKLNMSIQNISKHLNLAKSNLINSFIERFKELMNKKQSK